MKTSIVISLSALTFSLAVSPVLAQKRAAINRVSTSSNVETITPFNLVTNSYQGYFADRGIPSNAAFIQGVQRGRITAEGLVKTAIAQGRLDSEKLNDQAYLNTVSLHLKSLEED